MAYVKGRYIRESVCLISDILEYTENKGIEAILFSADFEKAFDSIDHTFYFLSSSHMGSVLILFNGLRHCSITRKVV